MSRILSYNPLGRHLPPRQTQPYAETPPGQTPPGTPRQTLPEHTPLRADTLPGRQSPGQTPFPQADTFSRLSPLPLPRKVRILLECILVYLEFLRRLSVLIKLRSLCGVISPNSNTSLTITHWSPTNLNIK